MALFTDGTVASVEDLLAYETGILDVAQSEQIDVTAKLRAAQEEVGLEVEAFLVQVIEGGEFRPGLGNVVVTEGLKKWHTFHSLALVYRDAHHHQLNDRFLGKWREYERLASWALRVLFQTGIGVVRVPVGRPRRPVVGTVGGPVSGATYFVAATWVDGAGREGSPSEPATLQKGDGCLMTVRSAGVPAGLAGWNVYAGLSAGAVMLQNDWPLGGGNTWTEPVTGLREGRAPGPGQAADYLITARRMLRRG